MRRLCLVSLLVLACAALPVAAQAPPTPPVSPLLRFADPLPAPPRVAFEGGKFAIRPGEVIVMTGSANGVFEQQNGYLETLLAAGAKEQRPVFRNMCWEGDTVYEQWRAMNFGRWGEQFDAVGASTVVLWFGQIEALDEKKSVEDFETAYRKLLEEFEKTTRRIVIITPLPFEKPQNPWMRDNTRLNDRVRQHAEVAVRLAVGSGAVVVDPLRGLADRRTAAPQLTENGMHLTARGQQVIAAAIAKELGIVADPKADLTALRNEIVTKNRYWFDCWRTPNWYFAYGDRTWTSFDKPAGGRPILAKELEQFKAHIRASDARIHALAAGQEPPALPKAEPEPPDELRNPDEELKSFQLREGLEANLWASEADGLIKPTQMVWDARGRLWVTCAPSYPQLIPGIPANDYILICEDTNGDGKADKFTKFAEHLTMPTGLCLGDGGAYVCEGTQLVHLADTDKDGQADARRVVLSGFGTGDSHQCINSITWGPDGNLWFSQGLHIYSLVETPWGLSRCHKTGIWRYNPRTGRLDNFLGNEAATQNAWGVGFDDWGQTFYTPGNEPGCFYIDPALIRVPFETLAAGQYRNIGRLAVTGTKGMRTEFIGTAHLPDDLQGVYIKSVYIAGHCELHRFKDDGAGFASDDLGKLISSPLSVFRPIETKVGPDGALYVCDWYNPIIGHYQASYRDPARDHVHGRIWRLTAKGRPLVKWPGLAEMTNEQLAEQLLSPERLVREQAKLLLYERPGDQVIPALSKWLTALDDREPAKTARALYEAIGIYAAHEAIDQPLLERLLASPDARVRAFGTHMLGLWEHRLEKPLDLVRRMIVDPHPRVRLEAVVAASYIAKPDSVEVATQALASPRDRHIDYAIGQTVKALKEQWYPALQRGELGFDGNADRLRFVFEADGTKDVAAQIRKLADNPQLDATGRGRVLTLLVSVGSPDDLQYAFEHGQDNFDVHISLYYAAQEKRIPPGDHAAALGKLLRDEDAKVRARGLMLVGAWKVTSLTEEVRKAAKTDDALFSVVAPIAMEALAKLEGRDALPTLTALANSKRERLIRAGAVIAVGSIDVGEGAKLTAPLLAAAQSEGEVQAVLMPLLSRRGGSEALAKQLAAVKLTPDAAKLIHRALSGAGIADSELVGLLNKTIGISVQTPDYDAALVKQIVADAAAKGDAARGRAVYLSKLANCAACHKLEGQGGDVGPELTNVGKSLSTDLLVEAVLWPNRQVKEGFVAVRVATDAGLVHTGFVVTESPKELVLRDVAANQVLRIAKARIEELTPAGSLMPAGLSAGMTSEELRDLVRFLSELGKR